MNFIIRVPATSQIAKKAAYSATFNCGGGFEPPTFGL
jgi:hypothetical protein